MTDSVSIPDDGSRSAGYVHGYVVGAEERSRLQARVRELETLLVQVVGTEDYGGPNGYLFGDIRSALAGGDRG